MSRNTSIFIVTLAILATLLTPIIYYYNFHINSSEGGLPLFAQFGDYFGGVLNPILTFATVILLYFSIRIQDRELNEIRREQEKM